MFPKYRHTPIFDPDRKRMSSLPSSRLFAGGHSSSMCDQASFGSGIKEQEGGGIQGWFRDRCRRSSDGRRLQKRSQTSDNRFTMTVSDAGLALNSRGTDDNRL